MLDNVTIYTLTQTATVAYGRVVNRSVFRSSIQAGKPMIRSLVTCFALFSCGLSVGDDAVAVSQTDFLEARSGGR